MLLVAAYGAESIVLFVFSAYTYTRYRKAAQAKLLANTWGTILIGVALVLYSITHAMQRSPSMTVFYTIADALLIVGLALYGRLAFYYWGRLSFKVGLSNAIDKILLGIALVSVMVSALFILTGSRPWPTLGPGGVVTQHAPVWFVFVKEFFIEIIGGATATSILNEAKLSGESHRYFLGGGMLCMALGGGLVGLSIPVLWVYLGQGIIFLGGVLVLIGIVTRPKAPSARAEAGPISAEMR